jgi:protein-tyrosine kinase
MACLCQAATTLAKNSLNPLVAGRSVPILDFEPRGSLRLADENHPGQGRMFAGIFRTALRTRAAREYTVNTLPYKGAINGLPLRILAKVVQSTPELRDAYNALLTSIRLRAPFGSHPSILVTSTRPNEGKTTIASCLAITAVLSGQTVLLVDADLRRPSLAASAGIANGIGFGEVIAGRDDTGNAITPVDLFERAETAGTLSVMTAGGKAPEFLAGVDWGKARTTIAAIAQRFGLILFDSPPILAANDALLLAGIVDGVLLVIGAGSADRDEVRRAKEQIEPIGTPLLGAVLNQFDPKLHGRPDRPYLGYNLNGRR